MAVMRVRPVNSVDITRPLPATIDSHVARGRHAEAERLLRERASALARRGVDGEAACMLVHLGRLLGERGRLSDAEQACQAAVALAERLGDRHVTAWTRAWLAACVTDAGRLAEAEAMLRPLREADAVDALRPWVTALLVRVCLWQRRVDEARALVDALAPPSQVDDATVYVEVTSVRALLAGGEVRAAGLRLDRVRDLVGSTTGPMLSLMLLVAGLRMAGAAGDLAEAHRLHVAIAAETRVRRLPLRGLRARLLWVDVLQSAGDATRVARETRTLRRVSPQAAPLVHSELQRILAPRDRLSRGESRPGAGFGAKGLEALIEACRDATSSERAVAGVAQHAFRALGASGVSLIVRGRASGDLRELAGAGHSCPLAWAGPALEEARPVEAQPRGNVRTVSVPIRHDDRVVGAIVSCWEGHTGDATHWLVAAAAAVAPRVVDCLRTMQAADATAEHVTGLIGSSPGMQLVRAAIGRAAPTPFPVFVLGESGVGKELVARALHALGRRRGQAFGSLNCAALPDELVESELFGHVRGAFTGALVDRPGVFEAADGGTLFLDEVVDLSPRAQAKLLRVLQEGEIRRLGEATSRSVDARIVSAANRDPRQLATEGSFRLDLVYRLDVVRIDVPPLRDRREDIPALAEKVWADARARVASHAELSADVVAALCAYDWPGNVRELQNVLATAAVGAPPDGRIGLDVLPAPLRTAPLTHPERLMEARRQFDREVVAGALSRAAGQRSRAARELGVTRQGLLKLMARVGLDDRVRSTGT